MTSKIELGKFQELIVVKQTDFGVFLNTPTGAEQDKILLPKAHVPQGTQLKDVLNVFVYKDSEDRPIATTLEPDITLGGVARLYVKEVTPIGAFLEWGLSKDLFLPFKEQLYPGKEGDAVLVTLYIDKSDRLCASMKVYESLRSDSSYQIDDEVFGRVYEISENFGVFVAVDDCYSGLIPAKEAQGKYRVGDILNLRVTRVQEDGKLDLSDKEKIPQQMEKDADKILKEMEKRGGSLPFTDKADPERIKAELGMSKAAFKRAVGRLMKAGKIVIIDGKIVRR